VTGSRPNLPQGGLERQMDLLEPGLIAERRLQDLGADLPSHVALVAVGDDAARLWTTWVGWGNGGIVLKDRRGCPQAKD
jgi:hypothetical protein